LFVVVASGQTLHFMISCRRFRFITVLFALCALLFAQLALAGYVCQAGAKLSVMGEMTGIAQAAMPCTESMALAQDDEQSGLCLAHCEDQQQSAYNYQVPPLAHMGELGVVLTLTTVPTEDDLRIDRMPHLRRDIAPPLAVRHCCLQI
jgi:hypothetical protein